MANKLRRAFVNFFQSYAWLTIVLIIVDQLTKYLALKNNVGVTVIPGFFYLELARNTGAAWSILDGNMGLLAAISGVAAAVIIFYMIRNRHKLSPLYKIVLATLLGGTLGNFIDRAFYKLLTGTPGVVDFILFDLGPLGYFPTFNIADMCITLSLITLIVLLFISDFKERKVKEVVTNEEIVEVKEENETDTTNN